MGKITDLLLHPSELLAVFEYKIFPAVLYPREPEKESETLRRCYELLNMTSRSFASVIQQLHPVLRDSIAIFYIVLRALDTIEDDMTLPLDKKIPLLRSFDKNLDTPGWTFTESGPNESDRIVLVEFDTVITEFAKLKPEFQEVIRDITHRMGNGMADYAIDKDFNRDGLETVKDYDLYCYYVAGIVGEGLTRMAIISKFGTPVLADNPELHLAMGLFLQKTNIIRDFREDLDDKRSFYPKELWSSHVNSLEELLKPEVAAVQGLHILTEMTINALELVPKVLEYLDNIQEPTLYRFCAIPQVMAIASLELVFNNVKVFTQNVKIRRGLACKLMLQARTKRGVYDVFREYTRKIHRKNVASDPNYLHLEILCGKIEQYIEQHYPEDPMLKAPTVADMQAQSQDGLMVLAFGAFSIVSICSLLVFIAYLMGADFSMTTRDFSDHLKDIFLGQPIDRRTFIQTTATAVESAVETAVKSFKDEL